MWIFGIYMGILGVKPSQSKFESFDNPEHPHTWTDLWIVIGLFGLYRKFPTLYDM